jgi:hypothetical protein
LDVNSSSSSVAHRSSHLPLIEANNKEIGDTITIKRYTRWQLGDA